MTEGKIRFYREVRPLVSDSAQCTEAVHFSPETVAQQRDLVDEAQCIAIFSVQSKQSKR